MMGAPEKVHKQSGRTQQGGATRWKLSSFDASASVAGPSRLSPRPSDSEQTRVGFEAGKIQGLAEGRAEAQRVLAQTRAADLRRVESLIAQLDAQVASAVAELDGRTADRLLDLALDIAATVVGSELRQRRDLLIPIIHEALETVAGGHNHPTVYLSPADHEWLRAAADQDARLHGCRLLVDAALPSGGCRIETAQAVVDASLRSRWNHVLQALGCEPEHYPLSAAGSEEAGAP